MSSFIIYYTDVKFIRPQVTHWRIRKKVVI